MATPAVDPARYREVIGSFATGVAIVTAQGEDGPAGLTTNAVTSLSLDPLLLLVCFDNASRTLPIVQRAGRFAVNVLHAGQQDLARVFASKRIAEEKFDAATHTVAHGVPVLDDALAWIACDLESLTQAGDHSIGIGRVTHLSADDAAAANEPLLFYRGGFARLAVGAEPPRSRPTSPSASIADDRPSEH